MDYDDIIFTILFATAAIESIVFLFSCFMISTKKGRKLADNGEDLVLKNTLK